MHGKADRAREHAEHQNQQDARAPKDKRATFLGPDATESEFKGAVTTPREVIHIAAHGLWCLAKGGGQLLLAALRGRIAAATALRLAAFGAGRLWGLAGLRYREYRTIHGA